MCSSDLERMLARFGNEIAAATTAELGAADGERTEVAVDGETLTLTAARA